MLHHRGKAAITLPLKNENKKSQEKVPDPPSHSVLRPIVILSLFVGYMPRRRLRIPGIFGGLLWLLSLLLHTAFDFMSARKVYGYAWASIQILLFINLVMCTYTVRGKVVPWLEKSLSQLDKENKYLKTFARIRKLFRVIPLVVIGFSLFGTGIQFFCFYYDGALSVSFEQPISKGWENVLIVVWFLTNVHLLFAFSFFWCVTACNMYTTGYSMTEYHDMMTAHLKNKDCPFTFRQAVHSFAERGSFLRTSASVCRMSLAFLVVYSIASLGVNAFYYLYKVRRAAYIFFALMPPVCSVYPLCLAAWVTKQYKWYLAVVVKAWAERPESSDEEDDSGSDQPRHKDKQKSFGRKLTKRVKSARRKDDTDDANKPRHRRSIFARSRSPESGSLSDAENPQKMSDSSKKPRRRSLFVRAKALPNASYSDTEGYQEKSDNDKPRRRSLFVRPKSAPKAFDNGGFSPEKKSYLSPQTKKKLVGKDDGTQFTSVSDTEKISDDENSPRHNELNPRAETENPKHNELNPSVETANQRHDKLIPSVGTANGASGTNWDHLLKESSALRQNNDDKRQKAEGDVKVELSKIGPPKRLEPLCKTSSISETEEFTENEEENNTRKKSKTQNILKPLDIRRPISGDEATDDESNPNAHRKKPKGNRPNLMDRLKPSGIRVPISEGEATEDENNPNTNDGKPNVNRQRVMELILRGTARAVGRLQHRAKLPKFNFEKYISYLQNVLPTIGFKIMGITVTWDMVSTLLFLEVSLLALFTQESIFGNQNAQVSL